MNIIIKKRIETKKSFCKKTVKNQVRLTVINNQAQNISIFKIDKK